MKIYYTDRFEGGRAESHRLLSEALSKYTGDTEKAKRLVSELRTGEKGKPYIEGFCYFSISHTGSIWAVLIADTECGLDIQLGKDCDIESIANRIYAAEDAARVADAVKETRSDGASGQSAETKASEASGEFFRIWCRREALVKAIGGSVYETDLPSVLQNDTVIDGREYVLEDISIPGLPHLYSAVCFAGDLPASPDFERI